MVEKSIDSNSLLKSLDAIDTEKSLPPVDKWHPERIYKIDIRIARDGTWYHEGDRIKRQQLVKLFSSILRKDADGKTYLVTPAEQAEIEVEDAHFQMIDFDCIGEGENQQLIFTNNVGDRTIADNEHAIFQKGSPSNDDENPYVEIRHGLTGRIVRAAYYRLIDIAVENEVDGVDWFGVWSCGVFFKLGRVDAAN
ncbi:MAG: DUF1285 domain-containing protein [Pseudomonadales bacterium]|nr:DUF1285 domain-containing protein [Pseudomonadales bacterium]